MPLLPPAGSATVHGSADPRGAMLAYRRFGATWLRIDLADRIASHAHAARAAGKAEPIDPALITSLGLDAEALRKLMAEIGFVPAGANWRWRGRRPERPVAAVARPIRRLKAARSRAGWTFVRSPEKFPQVRSAPADHSTCKG